MVCTSSEKRRNKNGKMLGTHTTSGEIGKKQMLPQKGLRHSGGEVNRPDQMEVLRCQLRQFLSSHHLLNTQDWCAIDTPCHRSALVEKSAMRLLFETFHPKNYQKVISKMSSVKPRLALRTDACRILGCIKIRYHLWDALNSAFSPLLI